MRELKETFFYFTFLKPIWTFTLFESFEWFFQEALLSSLLKMKKNHQVKLNCLLSSFYFLKFWSSICLILKLLREIYEFLILSYLGQNKVTKFQTQNYGQFFIKIFVIAVNVTSLFLSLNLKWFCPYFTFFGQSKYKIQYQVIFIKLTSTMFRQILLNILIQIRYLLKIISRSTFSTQFL